MPQKKNYTLNDIAHELGVNKATVSKAISGKGNLSAATRARILEFVDRCGYQPNAVAQSLARSKSYNIGLMMPSDASTFDKSFFRDCLQGVCRRAAELGYDVLITMDSEDAVEHIDRLIRNKKIDGVIAMRSLVRSPVVGFLKEKKVPFVLIGSTSDPTVISVDNDNRAACKALTARLIADGARRMLLLGGSENNYVTGVRLNGFLDACREAGIPEEDQKIHLNVEQSDRIPRLLEEALADGIHYVVCMDDDLCARVLAGLHRAGKQIPADVKVVSFYDADSMERYSPSITAISFDAVELGAVACSRLLDLLEGGSAGAPPLPGYRIMMREST